MYDESKGEITIEKWNECCEEEHKIKLVNLERAQGPFAEEEQ